MKYKTALDINKKWRKFRLETNEQKEQESKSNLLLIQ